MTSLISSVYIPFHGFTLISVLFAFPRTTLSINSGDGVIKLLQMLNKFVFSLSSLPVQRCSLLVHRQSVVICFLFVFPHLVRAPASNSFPPVEPPLLPPASCLRHTLSHTINSQTMMQFVSFCFFVGLPVPTSVTPRGSRPIICPSAEVKKNQFHIPYTSSPHTPCAARCAVALIWNPLLELTRFWSEASHYSNLTICQGLISLEILENVSLQGLPGDGMCDSETCQAAQASSNSEQSEARRRRKGEGRREGRRKKTEVRKFL